MRQSPKMEQLEQFLRSCRLVSDGFLGQDERDLQEIANADAAELRKLGYTPGLVAEKMQQLTDAAKSMLGNPVQVGRLVITYEDYKGMIVCPWPHSGRFAKAITTVKQIDTNQTIRWTDLNTHMIAEHAFFEGKGSAFRIEPAKLVKIIFAE